MLSTMCLPVVATLLTLLLDGGLSAPSVGNLTVQTEEDKRTPWEPNYCNNTKLQADAGLHKSALGQFLGYDCDSSFYQCRWNPDGYRTYRKQCRKGLTFDTKGTQSCNYNFNVVGCGTKQCTDCFPDQFACCLSEECIDMGKRCDSRYDCTLEEDEQNCPSCTQGQFPCVVSEQCIPFDRRCNGVKDCVDGTDELNCDICKDDHYYCGSSKNCIEAERRCDGIRDCTHGEDESFCEYEKNKDYTCESQKLKVKMSKVCDGVNDCPDASDEAYCNIDYDTANGGNYKFRKVVSSTATIPTPSTTKMISTPKRTTTATSAKPTTTTATKKRWTSTQKPSRNGTKPS